MSRNPKSVSTNRDNKSRKRDNQAGSDLSGFSARYVARAEELELKDADISRASGIPTSTLSRYRNGGSPRAEHIFPLVDALRCSARWLISGSTEPAALQSIDTAEWVEVPEYDLRQMDDASKGPIVRSTQFRRDWLNRSFGRDRGLWLTKLPSDYSALDLREGDEVICYDITREDLSERHLCIWRVPVADQFVVARYSVFGRNGQPWIQDDGEYWVSDGLVKGDLEQGTGADFIPVGRIVGRPLSPIR